MSKQRETLDKLENMIKSHEIIGAPYQIEGMTFIPIIDTIIGLGIGSSKNGGGGGYLSPKALIIINQEKEVSLLPLIDNSSDQIKEKLPEILGSLDELKKSKEV
ncbi:spore germination protein GerW family protein [Orenia metallireducens]|uniref:spore germination protein GerW family protein n=1 Tax=Orenia metallireducens TaxID=1413210 RepID=UPI0015521771|nr:spore germination protein GerW family protein [Orenia metallireducens]